MLAGQDLAAADPLEQSLVDLLVELAPLDRLGLRSAQLKGQVTWRDTKVLDPLTRSNRQISTLHPVDWEVHFSQALPQWRMPEGAQAPWLLVVGVTALTAHYSLTRALRLAEMSVVLPIDFLRLPLVAVVGYALYGETVGLLALAGALLIVAANVINLRAAKPR